jgi:hypothetical protein
MTPKMEAKAAPKIGHLESEFFRVVNFNEPTQRLSLTQMQEV